MTRKLMEYYLSRRIPYNVRLTSEFDAGCVLRAKHMDFYIKNDYKPILRSLKLSVNKEILHRGEKFIPSERLWELFQDVTKLDKAEFLQSIYQRIESNQVGSIPYCICEKLLEWNFQLDEPEEAFIQVEFEETNIYEQ